MTGRILILVAAVLLTLSNASAKVVKGFTCKSAGQTAFVVDSIDFRADLTRFYGKIKGKPHFSDRIDRLTLKGAMSNTPCTSTDIDGIDMKRWYQFEDSGMIPVEIDFPPFTRYRGITTIAVSGPKGDSTWTIVSPQAAKSKRTINKKRARK